MDLYVAVVAERHIDPIIAVFTNLEPAIAWASACFFGTIHHPDDGDIEETRPKEGWLWMLQREADLAWIDKVVLDQHLHTGPSS